MDYAAFFAIVFALGVLAGAIVALLASWVVRQIGKPEPEEYVWPKRVSDVLPGTSPILPPTPAKRSDPSMQNYPYRGGQ